jgi:transcriptional regulator with XRE-family HTH domain
MTQMTVEKSNNVGFAKRLKLLRVEKDLSQKDIATRIDVHFTTYGYYERGETMPTAETLRKLSNILGVSIDYLLEGKETEPVVADVHDQMLVEMFKEINTLKTPRKEFVKDVISALLTNEKVNKFNR